MKHTYDSPAAKPAARHSILDIFEPKEGAAQNSDEIGNYDRLVIDAGGLAVTAWAANKKLERAEDRVQTGIVIFVSVLASLAMSLRPGGRVVCAWDGKDNRAFRRGRFPFYKHGRGSVINRQEVRAMINELSPLLEAMGVCQIEIPGHEADDVVATVVTINPADQRVLVFSDDKDYLQLICPTTHLMRRSLRGIILSPGECEMNGIAYGDRYLAIKALMGDPGDNLKGLPGIGEKKAVEIVNKVPDVLERCNNGEMDWDLVGDKLKTSIIKAGRKLVFPRPASRKDALFAAKFAASKGLKIDGVGTASWGSPPRAIVDCLDAAETEVVKMESLMRMATGLDVTTMWPNPAYRSVPGILRRLGLHTDGDIMTSLLKLAGAIDPGTDPGWKEVDRMGADNIDHNPEDMF